MGPGWFVDDITLLATGFPPTITKVPTNQTVIASNPVAFFVEASGTAPFSYQWRFNGAPIPDATDASYNIPAAQINNAGNYDVAATNLYGSATSVPPALLTVLVFPSIADLTMQRASPAVEVTNVTFCVTATGTQPISYQRRRNGASIPGATLACHTLVNVQAAQAGTYSVAVSNAAGGLVSIELTLAVLPDWRTNIVGATGDGSYTLVNGVFTVNGSGEDIEGTKDDFFFVHKPLVGDGQIIARVLTLVPADPNSEAGVMFRDGTNSGARHVFLPLKSTRQATFRRRLAENEYSVENTVHGTNSNWLRLMRMGETYVGHTSANGVDWSLVWWTTLLNMPTNLEAGLAVTAHKNRAMGTAQFDNVTTGPLASLSGVWPQAGP